MNEAAFDGYFREFWNKRRKGGGLLRLRESGVAIRLFLRRPGGAPRLGARAEFDGDRCEPSSRTWRKKADPNGWEKLDAACRKIDNGR